MPTTQHLSSSVKIFTLKIFYEICLIPTAPERVSDKTSIAADSRFLPEIQQSQNEKQPICGEKRTYFCRTSVQKLKGFDKLMTFFLNFGVCEIDLGISKGYACKPQNRTKNSNITQWFRKHSKIQTTKSTPKYPISSEPDSHFGNQISEFSEHFNRFRLRKLSCCNY